MPLHAPRCTYLQVVLLEVSVALQNVELKSPPKIVAIGMDKSVTTLTTYRHRGLKQRAIKTIIGMQ